MSKFKCPKCGHEFEMTYFKWLFTTAFHTWTKRRTKCPNCLEKSWMARQK